MAEYIESKVIKKLISDACAECREACEEFDGIYADCEQCLLHSVKSKLQDIPTADVRPVVLCIDCTLHNRCVKESLFNLARIEEPFCCVGHSVRNPNEADGKVKGEWIASRNTEFVNREFFYDCSICGFTTMDDKNTCPNCGADMRPTDG